MDGLKPETLAGLSALFFPLLLDRSTQGRGSVLVTLLPDESTDPTTITTAPSRAMVLGVQGLSPSQPAVRPRAGEETSLPDRLRALAVETQQEKRSSSPAANKRASRVRQNSARGTTA